MKKQNSEEENNSNKQRVQETPNLLLNRNVTPIVQNFTRVQTPLISALPQGCYLTVEQNFVGKWYKEKGGDGKWIKFVIMLKDVNGNVIPNRIKIDLKFTLFYELNKKNPVENQTILRFLEEIEINPLINGMSRHSIRIEDISSKHCHQNFIIKIEALALNYNITPVFTKPVEVLSRPAKQKKAKNSNVSEENISGQKRKTEQKSSDDQLQQKSFNDQLQQKSLDMTNTGVGNFHLEPFNVPKNLIYYDIPLFGRFENDQDF